MIFPEGISETVRKLRPIKTGTARIALGAEEQFNFNLGVQIVPVGINYSNPHYFRSDVFVNFGSPVTLDHFEAAYKADPVAAVQELTATLKDQLEQMIIMVGDQSIDQLVKLEQMIIMVGDQSIDQLVKDIERLYRGTLREELPPEHKASQDFYLTQEIVKAVNYNKQKRPKQSLKFKQKIRQYFQALDGLNISDSEFRIPGTSVTSRWRNPFFIVGLPVFLYGFLVNILPYMTVGFLSSRVRVRADFIGSMKLAFGMFVFLLFYILEITFCIYFTNWIWGIVFALSLYPSGLFTVNYINQWYRLQAHLTFRKLKSKRRDSIDRLQAMREELFKELDQGRKAYIAGIPSKKQDLNE
jgi:hypothetical protein